MARIRSIKPEFWTDSKVLDLSDSSALFFVSLWTFADDYGYFEIDPRELSAKTVRWRAQDIPRMLEALEKAGLIRLSRGPKWRAGGVERRHGAVMEGSWTGHGGVMEQSWTGHGVGMVVSWHHQRVDKKGSSKFKDQRIQWDHAPRPATIRSGEERRGEERSGEEPIPTLSSHSEPVERTVQERVVEIQKRVESERKKTDLTALVEGGDKAVHEWGITLRHFRYDRKPEPDKLYLLRQIQQRGLEKVCLALIGARKEPKTDKFDPAKYLSLDRIFGRQFDRFVTLGSQQDPEDGRRIIRAEEAMELARNGGES